ncbi:PREDICTED: cytosolic carboxypeptidase 2-like [Priapulus caudatus]|uniref:Cytosolic carboxypeptidase 2-like n=1 Tax=Priapulus caudatus TaxID=37621 RepID=A0ABM1EUF6_PRICU|nr:PREDICTED: cytosolic carboxypeptidase 2-like [Priapulus caudatus]
MEPTADLRSFLGQGLTEQNPYESFMRKHLQYYGYYTGGSLSDASLQQRRGTLDGGESRSGSQLSETRDGDAFASTGNSRYLQHSDSCSSINTEDSDFGHRQLDGGLPDEEEEAAGGALPSTTQVTFATEEGRLVPQLRAPRNLYSFSRELGSQQATRWPTECQVLKNPVKLIEYVPPKPEPFYERAGTEMAPIYKPQEVARRLVFDYAPTTAGFFLKSAVGGSKHGCLPVVVKLQGPTDATLVFESRFESGNLATAEQISEFEYELKLSMDMYTNRHRQWFYFRVTNVRAGPVYRFTIANMAKAGSLYEEGMKPLFYSERDAAKAKIGWRRTGNDINYYKNNLFGEDGKSCYSLSFTFKFDHNKDTCYFAYCYPYTYSDLQDAAAKDSFPPMLNIREDVEEVVCTAEVADALPPGWAARGWGCCVERLRQEREVLMYCDLHGHSRNQNIFIYGCEDKENVSNRMKERVFPFMLSKRASNLFSFDSCKFLVQKSKEGTGRVVMWKLGIPNAFTMEATFCGATIGENVGTHFSTADLEDMGRNFCRTLLEYSKLDTSEEAYVISQLADATKRNQQLRIGNDDDDGSDADGDDDSSDDGGSDSSVSDGLPVHYLGLAAKFADGKKSRRRPRRRRYGRQQVLTRKTAQESDTSVVVAASYALWAGDDCKQSQTVAALYSQSLPWQRRRRPRRPAARPIPPPDDSESSSRRTIAPSPTARSAHGRPE